MEVVRKIENSGLEKQLKVKDAILSGKSEVLKIYDGSVVFVTGVSGFVGKQLVEKLLRTCNVEKIYFLLRSKKGKNATQRLKQILEDPVYNLLRREQPNFAAKLVPVEGDISELNLGISEDNQKKIAEEVNIIFHAAATINFEEPIKTATLINLRGTREVLSLGRICKNLKSIVHISTAYSFANKSRCNTEIPEEAYQSPLPPESLIQLAENLDNDKLDSMIKPIMGDWPNTYTFTKAVAEDFISQNAEDLPVCIVRPSIVVAAYKEPTPGWIDANNVYGTSGTMTGIALGLTHAIFGDAEIVIDLVPVDILNNIAIVAAWETYQRYNSGDKRTKIYFMTGTRNPFLLRNFVEVITEKCVSLSSAKSLWYCFALITKYKSIFLLLTYLFHYIPGYIVDGIFLLLGEKPRLINIYKKMYTLSSVFGFFTNNSWIFRDDNALDLYNRLQETDKEIFHFDMGTVDITEMVVTWMYGIRKFILKDDISTLEYGTKKQRWLRIANFVFLPLYFYCLFKVFCLFFVYINYFFNLFSSDHKIGSKM